jgi:hypothetical protein
MNRIKSILGSFLTSKKALAFLSGLAVLFASKHGLDIDPDTVNKVLALAGSYIVGQGIADIGKERAKVLIEADAKHAGSLYALLNDAKADEANKKWAQDQLADIFKNVKNK